MQLPTSIFLKLKLYIKGRMRFTTTSEIITICPILLSDRPLPALLWRNGKLTLAMQMRRFNLNVLPNYNHRNTNFESIGYGTRHAHTVCFHFERYPALWISLDLQQSVTSRSLYSARWVALETTLREILGSIIEFTLIRQNWRVFEHERSNKR